MFKFKIINMKTKRLTSILLIVISSVVFAQETPDLQKKIKNYTEKIDSIVVSEKSKMNEEINLLEKQKDKGLISKAELQEKKDEIAKRYETIINEKVENESSKMEIITKETVRDAVYEKEKKIELSLQMGNRGLTSLKTNKANNPAHLLDRMDLILGLGFISLVDSQNSLAFLSKNDQVYTGQSNTYLVKKEKQIGKIISPLFIGYGVGLRADHYSPRKSRIFTQGSEQLLIEDFNDGDLKFSALQIQYAEIPVDLSFVLNPKYIDYEGKTYLDASKKQFRIGLGVYGGVRFGNRIKHRYSNDDSRRNKFIQKVENGVNPFLFGGRFSVSYGGLNVFVKKDFTRIFDNDALINNKYGLQIGIDLINLEF